MSGRPSSEVLDEPEVSRYVITVDGAPAGFAQYVRHGGRVFIVHTEVDAAFEGKGWVRCWRVPRSTPSRSRGRPEQSVDRELLARIDGD